MIVTESLFSMDGDLAPLLDLHHLANRYGAWLVVDEAHATGLFGQEGRGLASALPAGRYPRVILHGGGKALGAAGAVLCCSAEFRALLINQARPFIFSTAPTPLGALHLALAAKVAARSARARKRCLAHAELLRTLLRKACLPVLGKGPVVPVVIPGAGNALRLASALLAAEISTRAIRYPTVPLGQERLRFCVRADHSESEIRKLASLLGDLL